VGPQNRNSQTWDTNFVGAQSGGGGLFGALNEFADSGGPVKMLDSALLGMSADDLAHGGIHSFGNIPTGHYLTIHSSVEVSSGRPRMTRTTGVS
jgi:hypothetical protein